MASAGAQCNHVMHVNTQLPYALTVAAVSFVSYLIAPFVGSAWVALPISIILMLATLFFLRLILNGPMEQISNDAVSHKVNQLKN